MATKRLRFITIDGAVAIRSERIPWLRSSRPSRRARRSSCAACRASRASEPLFGSGSGSARTRTSPWRPRGRVRDEELLGRYVRVVNGHTHRRGVTHVESTTFINAGTLAPESVRASGWLFSTSASWARPRAQRRTRYGPSIVPGHAPAAPADPAWRVTAFYREPTYEASPPPLPVEFRASYVVNKGSDRKAIESGLA